MLQTRPAPGPVGTSSQTYAPNEQLWVVVLVLLLVVPPLIGWAAGRLVGGVLGKILGAGVPVVGWGVFLIRAFSGPSDYGMNGTIGGPVTFIACAIAGGLGWLAAHRFDRRRPVGSTKDVGTRGQDVT